MSRRPTKSFFDADHGKKPAYYPRKNGYYQNQNHGQYANYPHYNTVQQQPDLQKRVFTGVQISKNTMNKLQSFAFQKPAAPGGAESAEDKRPPSSKRKADEMDTTSDKPMQPPQTPAPTRFNLSQLVNSTPLKDRLPDTGETPDNEAKIGWKMSPVLKAADLKDISAQDLRDFLGTGEKGHGSVTESPNPAEELWNRYDSQRPANSVIPALDLSSPPTPARAIPRPLRRTGLHRSRSLNTVTGEDLGGSAPKRRRIQTFDTPEGREGPLGRVAGLVEKVKQSQLRKSMSEMSPLREMLNNASINSPAAGPAHPLQQEHRAGNGEGDESMGMDEDDEFGDLELGEEEMAILANVEFAATQKMAQQSQRQGQGQAQTTDDASDYMPSSPLAKMSQRMAISPKKQQQIQQAIGDRTRPPPPNPQSEDYGSDMDMDFEAELQKYDTPTGQAAPQGAAPSGPTGAPANLTQDDVEALMDGVDFDEWDEGVSEILDQKLKKSVRRSIISRYLVKAIEEGPCVVNGFTRCEKILTVQEDGHGSNSDSQHMRTVRLREDWWVTPVREGDYVHVVGRFDECGECVVDNADNLIILHPDYLVSATVVADSFQCMRRAILQDRVKATGETTKALVYGSVIHELFQEALSRNDFSEKFLFETIEGLIVRHMEQLFLIDEPPEVARVYLQEKCRLIQGWAQTYMAPEPKTYSHVTDHRAKDDKKPRVCINKVLDIEEHIWSPRYGLKGNIDATVQIGIEQHGEKRKTLTVPFELKTGKNSKVTSHRAQTMLYTLMMSDRYDIDVLSGLLCYVEGNEMIRVPAVRNEVRGLIIGRNELAGFIKDREALPAPIKNEHACKRCYANESCLVYLKADEDYTASMSGLGEWFDEKTGHITPKQAEFFKHWDRLLTQEEGDMFRFRKELWSMVGSEREKVGRAFAGCIIVPGSLEISSEAEKINRYTYRFIKKPGLPGSTQAQNDYVNFSFLNSQINEGEPIVISDEKGHFALANGYVTELRPNMITVAVDRRLHHARTRQPGFHETDNQTFAGILEVTKSDPQFRPASISLGGVSQDESNTYRIDRDEFKNGMALVRNNLVRLMSIDGDEKRRQLIVDLAEPRFEPRSTQYPPRPSQSTLNVDQLRAIERVMMANDYALVLGMPGTGKTTTIAHIIRALTAQGKSILLTSYTHTAVDNILLKIKDDGLNILRLGGSAKVHPDVKQFTAGAAKATTFMELNRLYNEPNIVATTCLSINHSLFAKRTFDYCIVDEASQITLPVCVGPLRFASKFILVGDHHQLPPLVRNTDALKGGLDVSLFQLLTDAHPQAVVNLEHQYRMNEDIMLLSNTLVYDGRLKCGTESVAKRRLKVPDLSRLVLAHASDATCTVLRCWLRDLLDDTYTAVFANTDQIPAVEQKKGDRITNEAEALLIKQTIDGLVASGVPETKIGVISVYRSQLKIISNHLRDRPEVEIHTADKFQGRDKECVIISLVRANEEQNVGDLLKDKRRINVAFTRAKSKLIVFGSRKTLQSTDLLREFFDIMDQKNWVYNLPPEAHLLHSDINVKPQSSPTALITPKKENVPIKKEEKSGNRKSSVKKEKPVKIKKEGEKKVNRAKGEVVLKDRPLLQNIANEYVGL
ncbi:hypothetical protein G7K_0906-t1 [Saitoella complicata NRRL Y-17804]|uniref:DNA replication ATP-dependent helicase/nuclease n=1 Tax=Saitoella complicata (strain BCRC 22490 / CBS 7301 / JCM 7358 / NBRC 10748 / NRRL Y-17804) TaxID=698492 RepID=A0A0E9N9W5_SAICN|nr:hypothetical protein G7K_0906-t1 [Saitoella complicata NRRL Y-17804]